LGFGTPVPIQCPNRQKSPQIDQHRRPFLESAGPPELRELQLNAWVLATRRALGPALLSWDGETHLEPPPKARRAQLRLHEDWSAEDLRDPRARPLRPDAMLEILGDGHEASRRLFLIEYDRTRRVDKNYDKFRRYDTFLCWWWRHTPLVDSDQPPFVIFICQDQDQRRQFLSAADRELTGHRWHPSAPPEQHDHVGRRRILFAIERDAHDGVLEAWRLPPTVAIGRRSRKASARRSRTPSGTRTGGREDRRHVDPTQPRPPPARRRRRPLRARRLHGRLPADHPRPADHRLRVRGLRPDLRLPDDRCQCDHWGYLFEGSFRVTYTDGQDEVVHAGEAYHLRPGHFFQSIEPVELIELSPVEEHDRTLAVITRNMGAVAP
jgi:hypothetical protein